LLVKSTVRSQSSLAPNQVTVAVTLLTVAMKELEKQRSGLGVFFPQYWLSRRYWMAPSNAPSAAYAVPRCDWSCWVERMFVLPSPRIAGIMIPNTARNAIAITNEAPSSPRPRFPRTSRPPLEDRDAFLLRTRTIRDNGDDKHLEALVAVRA